VEKAIEEVSAVIDTLRSALEDMDELLEMLEMFERQKNANEREIDSLRRALRQMHRPRDAGHHPHR
jgi:chaperonin cofactor prefoldin